MDKMKDSGIKWIGVIPEKWELRRWKNILKERKEKNDPIVTDFILSLSIEQGVFPYSEKKGGGNKAKDDLSAYKVARPNDIVINSMNILAGAVGLSSWLGAVSPVYYTFYSDNDCANIDYYYYLFQTKEFQKSLMGLGNGILIKESSNGKLNTIRMRIPSEKLNCLLLPIPPINEQQQIAKFLDEKTALIDGIITDTKQTIEELKSYKQSLISEIVTKGLDSSETLVPSGVEWIGDSPKEWNKFTIGQLFEQVRKKNTGMIETNLLSLSYGRIKKRDINSGDGLLPESFEGYNIIETDDIVLRMTDLQNDKKSLRQGISEERGIITSAYITIRATKKVSSRFVYYQLFGFDVNKGYYGMGSGVRQSVNWNDVKKLPLMLPSFELQNQIADFLDRKTAQIDTLITEKENVISEYENYKKSMIYEYVTGKKRVDIDEGDLN